jgi:hypothetical protein
MMMVNTRLTYLSLVCCGVLSVASHAQVARAQEICSLDDVDTTLSQMSCVADGVYISPADLAATAADRCGDAASEIGCRRCFKKSFKRLTKGFKELVRSGLVERGWILSVRAAFLNAQDDVCSEIGDEPNFDLPDSTPTAAPSPSPEPMPTFSPTYPAEPTPVGTPGYYGGGSYGSQYPSMPYPNFGGRYRYSDD